MSKNILKRFSRKSVSYLTIAVVIIVAGVFAYESIYRAPSSASASVTRTVQVTRGTVQSSVSASGNLSSVSSASENFVDGGTLATLNATVGQKVTAGQILATLDSTQASATAEGAESSLKVSKMNLTNAETSNATLQSNLNTAKSTLSTDESGGTTVQKDQNQSSVDSAEQQLTSDQNQLTTAQSTLSTDETNLATAQSTYSSDEALGCPPAPSSAGTSGSASGTVTANTGGAPSLSTDGASSVTTSEADLNATINPNGAATTYYFEYGTTDAFGDSTAVLGLSSGSNSSQVSTQISGLIPSTTYIFTVIASNVNGTSEGEAITFTTPESSCAVDSQTISTDETQVTSDDNQITSDQSTITTQGLAVQVAQQNLKPSSTTIDSDKSAITQDEASIAQGKVSLVQDEATITQNELTVEQDEKALQETQLVALISGTITAVNGTVGQVVGGGGSSTASSTTASSSSTSTTGSSTSGSSSALISIQGLQQFQVVASFAEADAIKIQAHQTATITLPALPNDEIKGVVTSIAPVSTVVSNVVTYPVTISLISPPASLREGMTSEVSVIVQTASNVLELPSAAITTTGSTSTVQVQTSKGVTKSTSVTLGLVGSSFTEITSGVTAGETIVEPQASVSAATTGAATPAAGGGGLGGGHFGGGAP
ncbi:MAG TPA: HlyD family efflux transporter periplasmic adaptor subunit [Acidimicrobiales bacterium]